MMNRRAGSLAVEINTLHQFRVLSKSVDDVRCAIVSPALYPQYFSPDADRWSRFSIRNIRNHSVGHPVDRRTSVVRVNLEAGFVYMITSVPEAQTSPEGGGKHWGGKLDDLLSGYLTEANDWLSAIAMRVQIKWPRCD